MANFARDKKRTGPGQTQVVIYLDADELAEFDAYVGKGNRSQTIRTFVQTYNRVIRERSEP